MVIYEIFSYYNNGVVYPCSTPTECPLRHVDWNFNYQTGQLEDVHSPYIGPTRLVIYRVVSIYFENGRWAPWWTGLISGNEQEPPPFKLHSTSDLSDLPLSCPACDTADDDNDGVCNSCDKLPGQRDPDDCEVAYASLKDGTPAFAVIDEGCKYTDSGNSDSLQDYRNSAAYNPDGTSKGTLYYNISKGKRFRPKTCNKNSVPNDEGKCACTYPPGGSLDGFSPPSKVSPETLKKIEDLKKNDENHGFDTCADQTNYCEGQCAYKGGVKSSNCRKDPSTGAVTSTCTCNDDSSIGINKPSDSGTGQPGGTSGITNPDLKNVTDSVNGAINNVNNSVNNLGGKIDAMGAAINGAASAISGVGDKLDGIGNKLDGVAGKFDGVGSKLEGAADKLESAADKLGQGFVASGSGTLPNANEYDSKPDDVEEDKLSDAIGDFISSGVPLMSYFKGTQIQVDSSVPTLSFDFFGRPVNIDFSGFEDVLHFMGLVLVACSTVLAFFIIVRRSK